MYLIIKTPTYKNGPGGIRGMLDGDKKRAVDFEDGKTIEVSKNELDNIKKLGWCMLAKKKEVKNGN